MAEDKRSAPDLSEEAARAGSTGDHVRYVLFFGLAGAILAFIVLAIYLGFDNLQRRISDALAGDLTGLLRDLAPYAAVVAIAAIAVALLLGLWSMVAGRSESASQSGMRIRVVGQFVIVCALMAMLYLAAS